MGLFGSKQQQQQPSSPGGSFSDDEELDADDAIRREQRAAEDIAQHRSLQHDDFPAVPARPSDVVLSIPAPVTSPNGSQNNNGPPWWLSALEQLPLSKELLLTSPSDSSFVFDLSTHVNEAKQIIGLFPSVNLLRLKLVPARMKDEQFWRNLFWHLEQFHRFGAVAAPTGVPASPPSRSHSLSNGLQHSSLPSAASELHSHAHSSEPSLPLVDAVSAANHAAQMLSVENAQLRSELHHAQQRLQEVFAMLEHEQKRAAALQSQLDAAMRPPATCLRCRQTISASKSTTTSGVRCQYHAGEWTLSKEAKEFAALEPKLKENLRAEKRKRLKEVAAQMAFIADDDNPSSSTGKWSCCGLSEFAGPPCASAQQHAPTS